MGFGGGRKLTPGLCCGSFYESLSKEVCDSEEKKLNFILLPAPLLVVCFVLKKQQKTHKKTCPCLNFEQGELKIL